MKKQLEQVREFQKTFNFPAAPVCMIPDVERCGLRVSLIEEEFDEVCEAIAMKNRENLAKELADLLYVVLGTMIDFGMPVTREGYKPMAGMARIVYGEMNIERLQEGIKDNSIREVFVSLRDLAEMVYDFVERYGLIDQFDEIFDEVHRSNMSKSCNFKDALDTLRFYETEKDTLCHKVETEKGVFLITRLSDGKLLKPVNYSPARLGGIL